MTLCATTAAADPPAAGSPLLFQEVRAIVQTRCLKCHGPLEPKGELQLGTPLGLARGGESGPAVVPGNLEESPLWKRVAAGEMPPDAPLPKAEQQRLRDWIAAGAPGLPPRPQAAVVGADHWAFQPLLRPAVPVNPARHSEATAIDAFVRQSLLAQGLDLSPPAAPALQLRRLAFDLTGLPPTPAELEQFLADPSEDNYHRAVEQYLASPAYAERWGKHWLDAAGYADSNGYFSADTDRPLAHRYRDYVIRSLNADKPFDRFVVEQLAGDELARFRAGEPTDLATIELLEATHFLRNGQDGTDIGVQEPEAFEIDRRAALEASLQVSLSTLLGLTVHCARCHDHKFEPITQREYYQLQAVWFPAFNPQDWINPKDRTVYAFLPGERERWEANEQRLTAELARLRSEYVEWLASHREPSELLLAEDFETPAWADHFTPVAPGDDTPGGELDWKRSTAPTARVVGGRLQIVAGPGEGWLSTRQPYEWSPPQPGEWIEVSFDLIDNRIDGPPAERIAFALAAHDYNDSSTVPGGNLLIDGHPSGPTSLYLDYPGTDQKQLGQIGEQGYKPGQRYGVRVTCLEPGKLRLEQLVDGLPDGKPRELVPTDLPPGGFAFFLAIGRSYVVDNLRIEKSPSQAAWPAAERERVQAELATRRQDYERRRSELLKQRAPSPGRAIAWVSDKSAKPPEVPLLTRGLYHLRGPLVEPGALAVLSDPAHPYEPRPPAEATTTGRRLGFAEWLTRPGGRPAGLLARVHVNRLWRQYFGRGLVETTDNVGLAGALPSHPELLDHLADQLLREGWNQKPLHRQLVLSQVYRQGAAAQERGLEVDPGNRLLWRWPVRRLEAELIRDAALAIAGELDRTPYGPYVGSQQTPVGEVVVAESTPGARRRSVYLQQRRSQTVSLLRVFDAPSIATICTARPSSTVPLQSLALLNSEFALKRGSELAGRVLREAGGSTDARLELAFQLTAGRLPTPAERELATRFLSEQTILHAGAGAEPQGELQAELQAWADLCQMLLASHPFLYLE